MTIEAAMRSVLLADSGVNAITTRIYPVTLPQDPAYPLILYSPITVNDTHDLRDTSDLTNSRMQIEAWAKTFAQAKALASAIYQALNQYSGVVADIRIGSCLRISERPMYEPDIPCHRIVQDYSVWYE